jgi:hypothetical protein
MKRIILLAAILAMSAGVADAKLICKDAKGKFIKCPPAAAAVTSSTTAMASSSTAKHPPHCVKGKACGNTCIKATDVCHK